MRVQGHRPTSSPRRSMPGLAFAVALATSGCGGAAAPAATAVPADDPAVAEAGRFVEGFFEAYLTEARMDPGTGRVTSALAEGGYRDDPRIGAELADQIDALREAAGEQGLSADPFVCAAEVPERAELTEVAPVDAGRMTVRIDMWHAGQAIPFPVTATVGRSGDGAWQLVGLECR